MRDEPATRGCGGREGCRDVGSARFKADHHDRRTFGRDPSTHLTAAPLSSDHERVGAAPMTPMRRFTSTCCWKISDPQPPDRLSLGATCWGSHGSF